VHQQTLTENIFFKAAYDWNFFFTTQDEF